MIKVDAVDDDYESGSEFIESDYYSDFTRGIDLIQRF